MAPPITQFLHMVLVGHELVVKVHGHIWVVFKSRGHAEALFGKCFLRKWGCFLSNSQQLELAADDDSGF